MKKRIISLIVGALLLCASFGLTACGEGYANYFNVIKNPKNFKIEYICGEDSFTEIRVGNKVALKTTWNDGGNHSYSEDTEWTIYANKYKEQSSLYYDSQLARTTDNCRYQIAEPNWEIIETTFLGREAIVYQQTSISGYVAFEGAEAVDRQYTAKFMMDKQYNIVLASYSTWEGDEEKAHFEVTVFEIGGQELPDNPKLS